MVQVNHQTATAGAAGMASNIICGGIIGEAVDCMTGATQKLVPNPVCVKLIPCRHMNYCNY